MNPVYQPSSLSRPVEASISKRLKSLQNTQGSIEKTSRALLKNKHSPKEIVKLWFKEFRAGADKQKLAFLHLANEFIQNGIENQQQQFAKLFEPVLPAAFSETARLPNQTVRMAVAHLLIVWAERQVYPQPFLRQLRSICQHSASQVDNSMRMSNREISGVNATPFNFSFTSTLINSSAFTHRSKNATRQQITDNPEVSQLSDPSTVFGYPASGNRNDCTPDSISTPGQHNLSAFREELQWELQSEAIKPPETLELIRQLESLQSAPSGNALIRQAISEFPSEISDVANAMTVVKFDTQATANLIERVKNALQQLEDYNHQLEEETAQRTHLSLSLHAYRSRIQEAIRQTNNGMAEIRTKLEKAEQLHCGLEAHIHSLPDICLRSDQTSNLEPLPSAGELFR